VAGKTESAPLVLSEKMLIDLSGSRTAQVREVERAKILLNYYKRKPISQIKRLVGVSRSTIYKCIDKALAAGIQAGLKDTYHSPKKPEILDDAKAWIINIACTKPKDHGLAAELWTLSELANI
jgi:transposase